MKEINILMASSARSKSSPEVRQLDISTPMSPDFVQAAETQKLKVNYTQK